MIQDSRSNAEIKSSFAGPSVAEKKDEVPPVGGDKKSETTAKLSDTQDDAGEKKTGEGEEEKKEGGGQSEALIRDSYLPANKLKDAPSASHYEGKWPTESTNIGAKTESNLQHTRTTTGEISLLDLIDGYQEDIKHFLTPTIQQPVALHKHTCTHT